MLNHHFCLSINAEGAERASLIHNVYLEIESKRCLILDNAKLTTPHYDASDRYLDFPEIKFAPYPEKQNVVK